MRKKEFRNIQRKQYISQRNSQAKQRIIPAKYYNNGMNNTITNNNKDRDRDNKRQLYSKSPLKNSMIHVHITYFIFFQKRKENKGIDTKIDMEKQLKAMNSLNKLNI